MMHTRQGKSIFAYQGIPYAVPPIGDRRFKEPEPIEPWIGTLDTKQDAPYCIQKNYLVKDPVVEGQEDCLYLNVYTHDMEEIRMRTRNSMRQSKLPVMVYIHGGGWFSGSGASSLHGPEYIMDEDVVLVTINYRLGVFGFLSTEDDIAPGNWAMKDMVLALKWVKDNIHAFCGNPDSVTIFGESAGAASVHYLMLSPMAQGLFHRAISQSGTALNVWATPISSNQVAQAQATFVDCPANTTSEELVDCLRTIDATALVESGDKFKFWSIEPLTVFIPTVEKQTLLNKTPFLTDTPANIIKKGKFHPVPLMIGAVANEGLLRAAAIIAQPKLRNALNSRWDELGPALFGVGRSVPEELVAKLWTNITDFYMTEKYINHTDPSSIQNYIDMYTDRAFVYAIYQSALCHANRQEAPVYFYRFSYAGTYTWSDIFAHTENTRNYTFKKCHSDDLLFLFRIPALFPDLPENSTDVEMSKKIVKLWTTFARDGTPAKYWDRVTGHGKVQYLDLAGPTDITMKPNYLHKRMQFWESLDIEENR
ncbi:Juvenile hormone esterase [Carabus blaptoides fortunei]